MLLAYFLYKSNLNTIYFYLKSISAWLFIGLILLSFLSIFINSIKWNLLLKKQDLFSLYKLNLISQFYTLILPGQIAGEAIKTVILGKDKNDMEGIAVSVVVDKITGFLGLFILTIFGLILTKIMYPPIILWAILAASAIGLSFLFCLQINVIFNTVNQFISLIGIKFPRFSKIVQSSQKVFTAWHVYSKQIMTVILSITIGILYQLTGVLLFFILSKNLNISISMIDWFWILGLLSIALFLPITIGGIGVREGTLVGILGSMGIAQEKALALSFAIFGTQIIVSLIGWVIATPRSLRTI